MLKNKKEKCVLCGKSTHANKSDDISKRNNYVSGCGQLCKKCYSDVYKK